MPVVRSENYQRFFADQALVMPLGRDIDIAFLAVGSALERVTQVVSNDEIANEMKMTPTLTEFGRVRIPPLGAVSMSMNILEQMIGTGAANKAKIIEAIEAYVEPADEDESEEDSPTEDHDSDLKSGESTVA